jgi:hypothetical protein
VVFFTPKKATISIQTFGIYGSHYGLSIIYLWHSTARKAEHDDINMSLNNTVTVYVIYIYKYVQYVFSIWVTDVNVQKQCSNWMHYLAIDVFHFTLTNGVIIAETCSSHGNHLF